MRWLTSEQQHMLENVNVRWFNATWRYWSNRFNHQKQKESNLHIRLSTFTCLGRCLHLPVPGPVPPVGLIAANSVACLCFQFPEPELNKWDRKMPLQNKTTTKTMNPRCLVKLPMGKKWKLPLIKSHLSHWKATFEVELTYIKCNKRFLSRF